MMKEMTIKEYVKKYPPFETDVTNYFDDETVDSWQINNTVGDFLNKKDAKRYNYLINKTDGWCIFLFKSSWDDKYEVYGNESNYQRYFDENTPMIKVYEYLLNEMEKDYEIHIIQNSTRVQE